MTRQESVSAAQEAVERAIEKCENCAEDLRSVYTRYPHADWLWALACREHAQELRTLFELHFEGREIEAVIPVLERIEKGKALLKDPKLSIKKAMAYKNTIKDLEDSIPSKYRGTVILELQNRLDIIRTDVLYWLKSF